jgi:hypothetical protein
MNTRFKVFASYNIFQYMCDFIHVLIFVTISKCRKSPKLMNIVIHSNHLQIAQFKCLWIDIHVDLILEVFVHWRWMSWMDLMLGMNHPSTKKWSLWMFKANPYYQFRSDFNESRQPLVLININSKVTWKTFKPKTSNHMKDLAMPRP